MKVKCDYCGKEFDRKPSQVKEKNYCSKECWYNSKENKNRPNRKTGEYRKCKQCGKEFYVQKSRIEKGYGQFCSQKCKGEYEKKYQKCPVCGKRFWNKGNSSERKYCSKECASKAHKNGSYVKCDYCGKEVYKTNQQLKNYENHFCSKECANKYQTKNKLEFKCKICGKKFYWSKSRVEQTNPTYCSLECRNKDKKRLKEIAIKANLKQQNTKEPTSIELMGRKILNDIGLNFEEQININDKFIVDVYIPDYNLIIQWDGDYWHCHSKYKNPDDRQLKRKKIDKSQNAYFKKCGYKLLRFWGSEIRKEIDDNSEYIRRRIQSITG